MLDNKAAQTHEELQNRWMDPYMQWYAAGMPAFILPAGSIEGVAGIVCCTRDGDKIHGSISHFKSESNITKSVGDSGLAKLKTHIQNELSLLGDKIDAKDNVYKVYVKMRDSARHEKFYEDVLLSA